MTTSRRIDGSKRYFARSVDKTFVSSNNFFTVVIIALSWSREGQERVLEIAFFSSWDKSKWHNVDWFSRWNNNLGGVSMAPSICKNGAQFIFWGACGMSCLCNWNFLCCDVSSTMEKMIIWRPIKRDIHLEIEQVIYVRCLPSPEAGETTRQ